MSTPSIIHTDRPPATGIKRHIPNLLVVARLIMTAVMIAVLSIYRFPDTNAWALPLATALFIIAAFTDALDGYLARKWNAVSVFGRIMDPTADKILVLGAFVMLAGPNFVIPDYERYGSLAGAQASGVMPWMVIVMLSRELLVTSMRGVLESKGEDFSATQSGKLKMVIQSVGVPLLLIGTWVFIAPGVIETDAMWLRQGQDDLSAPGMSTHVTALSSVQNTMFWFATLITLITALSAIPYITRARAAFKSSS